MTTVWSVAELVGQQCTGTAETSGTHEDGGCACSVGRTRCSHSEDGANRDRRQEEPGEGENVSTEEVDHLLHRCSHRAINTRWGWVCFRHAPMFGFGLRESDAKDSDEAAQ